MNSPRRVRVLIIDRDPRVRQALRDLLTTEPDLEICAAVGDTGAALAQVNAERPDVALLDLLLPGPAEGLGLMLALHRLAVPVVVLTAASWLREQAQDRGAAAFLEKDHNLHLIPRALRTAGRDGRLQRGRHRP